MRLAFNFKNGDNLTLSEAETKSVFKQNYLKLLAYAANTNSIHNKSIRILGREIKANDLKSVEVLI
jgi:hypothetical protein